MKVKKLKTLFGNLMLNTIERRAYNGQESTMDFSIEKMKPEDWQAVKAIYQDGIATGNATFETEVPDWDEWNESHLVDCRLVARAGDQIVGWAALSPVSGRCVYAGVAEVSVYVVALARGMGIGKALLGHLCQESEQASIWTLEAGIFSENRASVAIHKACGFREVGYRERLGQLGHVWRDVILMERRSKVVGI
jgi:L-amino acid N-acyltransferase YncA